MVLHLAHNFFAQIQSSLYLDNFLYLAITANDHPQLMARSIGENTLTQSTGVELIGWVITVDKLDDLLWGHPSTRVTALLSKVVFLLRAPFIHILGILRINLNKGVKQVGETVIFA